MKIFLTDLWNDLRAKRLWPLALLLLAGMVAVPVVLSKPSETPPAAPPQGGQARTAPEPRDLNGLASVKLEENTVKGSALDTFDPSNPFRPPSKVLEGAKEEQAGTGSGPGSGSRDSGSTGSTGSTDSGGGGGSPTPSPVVGGPIDTGDGGDAGGSDGGGQSGDPQTTTTNYVYVVDLTFTANGRTRRIKGMERLDMLPSEAQPMLLFLGVSASGGNGVFLVDSTLQAAGEGRCKPSMADCAFLHIGAGSEHEFTNEDGDSYRLRIDEIRKVKVGAPATASSNRGKAATAALGTPETPRRFVPPMLADLVSLSSGRTDHSNSDRDRR